MKRLFAIFAVLLAFICCEAETRPDGSTSIKYGVSCDRAALEGWEVIEYMENSGLLLSAFTDGAEITVSLEDGLTAEKHLSSAERYADIAVRTETDSYLSYDYTLKRGKDTETVYSVDMYFSEFDGKVLAVTMTSWIGGYREMFMYGFAGSVSPVRVQLSDDYLALMTGCHEADGSIYIDLDFVLMDYDSIFESVIFLNEDATSLSYQLSGGALVYLPDLEADVYTIENSGADAEKISHAIKEFNGIHGQDALYLVAFDANNRIIRMQHYNAL